MAEVATAVNGGGVMKAGFIWTREDLNLPNRTEFNNSAKVLGVADDAGSYAFLDEFGNTFRSFFFAYDNQDLSAARVYSKTVGNNFCNTNSAINEKGQVNDPSDNAINYVESEYYGDHHHKGQENEEEDDDESPIDYQQTDDENRDDGKSDFVSSLKEEFPCDSIDSEGAVQSKEAAAVSAPEKLNPDRSDPAAPENNCSAGVAFENGLNGKEEETCQQAKIIIINENNKENENINLSNEKETATDSNGTQRSLSSPGVEEPDELVTENVNYSAFPDRGEDPSPIAPGSPLDSTPSCSSPGQQQQQQQPMVRCRRRTRADGNHWRRTTIQKMSVGKKSRHSGSTDTGDDVPTAIQETIPPPVHQPPHTQTRTPSAWPAYSWSACPRPSDPPGRSSFDPQKQKQKKGGGSSFDRREDFLEPRKLDPERNSSSVDTECSSCPSGRTSILGSAACFDSPTTAPTWAPSVVPTALPTLVPTAVPTAVPTNHLHKYDCCLSADEHDKMEFYFLSVFAGVD
eukprot:gene32129-41658_t